MCVSYNIFSLCCILLKMWCIIFIIKLGSNLLKCNFLLHCMNFFCIIVLCFCYCCCASVLHSQICCQSMHSLSVMFVVKDHNDFNFFHICYHQPILYIFVFHWSIGCIIVFLLCVIVCQSATSYSTSTSFLFCPLIIFWFFVCLFWMCFVFFCLLLILMIFFAIVSGVYFFTILFIYNLAFSFILCGHEQCGFPKFIIFI
jgi:hypothetical protein